MTRHTDEGAGARSTGFARSETARGEVAEPGLEVRPVGRQNLLSPHLMAATSGRECIKCSILPTRLIIETYPGSQMLPQVRDVFSQFANGIAGTAARGPPPQGGGSGRRGPPRGSEHLLSRSQSWSPACNVGTAAGPKRPLAPVKNDPPSL